ncbi:MAG: methylenetetrahydrofolate--tRNA-(uracil(54)-C(5))-methyltransferase (FADH(2)-oxidizing) TrmFO [Fimbriimonadaceae bacterium]
MRPQVHVIGAGFAGAEAAWAAASRGADVVLYEMRPVKMTPAHKTDRAAELVCSNSFKSKNPDSPAGLLKTEMEVLGSLVLPHAHKHSVPGGEALAVDRDKFSEAVTKAIESQPRIRIERREVDRKEIEQMVASGDPVIIATGPLTSDSLSEWLAKATGSDHLFFFDAVSPTVDAQSLDRSIVFAQSRYDKGGGDDYLNCPFNKDEYYAFVEALVSAERTPLHEFEKNTPYFQGCMPIEAIAEKGERSLAFGNFKPVGLTDPRTGRRPYAALQLRPENREKTLYSMVACQTRLKWGEQTRIFRMVPGLENAEFVRLGVIHRNTYIDAPQALNRNLSLKSHPNVFIAGQLSGVEGYLESAAIGILAGIHAVAFSANQQVPEPPRETAYGSLLSHLTDQTERDFAPMNINWGLLPDPLEETRDKGVRRAKKLEAARAQFQAWSAELAESSLKTA